MPLNARCQTMWIRAYGQKLAIRTGLLDEEPAQVDHRKQPRGYRRELQVSQHLALGQCRYQQVAHGPTP